MACLVYYRGVLWTVIPDGAWVKPRFLGPDVAYVFTNNVGGSGGNGATEKT